MTQPDIDSFIARWQGSGGAERANYTQFLAELCDVLGVHRPHAASGSQGDYRFERAVVRHENDGTTSNRRIDLYKRDCFVLEAKQASDAPEPPSLFLGATSEAERRSVVRRTRGWAQSMLKAKGQAEDYARDLPAEEGWPPFVMVCDVGFCIDLYADFSRTGKHYAQFPDRENFRVYLTDLTKPETRDLLGKLWTEPMALDPTHRRVQVTKEIASHLAHLAEELERRKHPPETVATFLMRCVFSMFAQSVGLLPSRTAFTDLLVDCRENLPSFVSLVGDLWRMMDKGGYSTMLRADVRRFNGGLFSPGVHGSVEPLRVDVDMLELLIISSRRDWSEVEPAIFGTLLENAISTRERGRLGAHFTPRAFVERLVQPVVIDPLLEDWNGVKAVALAKSDAGDTAGAAAAVREFHARLCAVRVLDPACGSGNFLYVALDMMKRLEGEVLDLLSNLEPGEGDRFDLTQSSVDPHQFLGIELNPRAVPVAELVLWLGYLQWHFRNRAGREIAEPILRDFHNIKHGDALLDYSKEEIARDKQGQQLTRWGGKTKVHPITGEYVPDETDRVLAMRPVKPKATVWPAVDFVVGNPPFIAGKDLREDLGDGYTLALWETYPKVNRSADLALHFWWKAAQLLSARKIRRFGFISSNSLRQVFSRRVVAEALSARKPIHLVFAVPDHPWTDGKGTAAVRIAMTAAASGNGFGTLARVGEEGDGEDGVPNVALTREVSRINADLTIGTDVKMTKPLRANDGISSPGVKLHGSGFIVSPAQAKMLGLGKINGLERHIRPYLNGRDIMQHSRGQMVIDLFGLTEDDVRRKFPAVYQHIVLNVKPERGENNRASYKDNWWIFGEPRRDLRPALSGLQRYIATVETTKHRTFVFLPIEILPDNMLIAIGSDDAFILGVLSSRLHVAWFLAACGWLGVGNDPRYNKTQCFDPYPFPDASPTQRATIAAIAEELDAHRKARLAAHPFLTLTSLYNVLAAIRAGTPLTPAETDIHDAGQVTIMRELHDRLDAAVADAYGWPRDLLDSEIVTRVVQLNAERVKEEASGLVRWLRPEFQAPQETQAKAQQVTMDVDAEAAVPDAAKWPKEEPAQFVALRAALRQGPVTAREIARRFKGAPRADRLTKMLRTLEALGQARPLPGDRFAA
jgi:hypothetical protein